MNQRYEPPQWMSIVLTVAGVYNLLWGLAAVFAPVAMLGWLGVSASGASIPFWQCIGMIVGVYGVGYVVAARSPYRHWLVVMVGLMGKVFGPLGFVFAVVTGQLPLSMSWTIVLNDLVWWIPFSMILWGAAQWAHAVSSAHEQPESDDPLRDLQTNTGQRLDDLADETPQMVVFLRHAGCTFCRQTLADVATHRAEIEATGCRILLVHLGHEDDQASIEIFQKYGVDDLPRISDPTSRLYRQFGLDLGGWSELFGLKVWLRGFLYGVVNGHGIGAVRGNSFQMPGVYLYHRGVILGGFRHASAADRPSYLELAQQIEVSEPESPEMSTSATANVE